LLEWLRKAGDSSGVTPHNLCFQVSEENATQYLTQTQALANELRRLGHRFAIESFGVGRDSGRILSQTPMDFLKIDGSLMQGVASDQALQEKVRVFVQAATGRGVPTIAERVEDANTMAVLFQLGVAYVQGHYVHEPEVVLAEVPLAAIRR
jgi:EAL domain-containing protein (putative c-di-GMP-specific phosphodiesterase class I)